MWENDPDGKVGMCPHCGGEMESLVWTGKYRPCFMRIWFCLTCKKSFKRDGTHQ